MRKLLIIDKNPYGVLIDTYKYCQYLQNHFDITYLCVDYGYPKMDPGRVTVKYVPYTSSRLFRGIAFTLLTLYNVSIFKGFIFVSYYPGCDLLKRVLFWKKMHLDIRTLSVSSNEFEREKWNRLLNKSILYFDSISVISEGIKEMLNIPANKRSFILPLGADIISSSPKNFDKLRLLYVGTLNNRRIIDTIIGFHNFVKEHPDKDIHYTIIGDGEELAEIKRYVDNNRLRSKVEVKGRLLYTELKPYFDYCNIGVAYVPITEYYQYQPPTKTFEYILSGLFCLATSTFENRKIVNTTNGVLHEDSSEAFSEALECVLRKMKSLDSNKIRDSLVGCTWYDIVYNYVLPLLNSGDNINK